MYHLSTEHHHESKRIYKNNGKSQERHGESTVYFRVRDNECDIKAASELAILPNYWDAKRQGYKLRVSLVGEQQRQDFDHAVQEILALYQKNTI